jgi:hypothetical protein
MTTMTVPRTIRPADAAASIGTSMLALESAARGADSDAASMLLRLHADVDARVTFLKRRLLGTALQWTEADRADARWIDAMQHRLGNAAASLLRDCEPAAGTDDPQALLVIAHALYHRGEAVKLDVVAGAPPANEYRSIHGLMRLAMARGHQRAPMPLLIDGARVECTIEALYFRALLLARLASGALNPKQIEILDAWIRMCQPVLRGVSEAPSGSAMRADLDSAHGLQRGPRRDPGPSLYLPQAPLEAAHRSIVAEMHKGNIVPAGGLASSFRVEEHVAVLELIARGLRDSRVEPVTRAARRPGAARAEMLVGLGEIIARGFSAPAPVPSPLSLAAKDGIRTIEARRVSDRDELPNVYEQVRRCVQLVDESDSGFLLEGDMVDCGEVAVADLVGLRFGESETPLLCCVTRRIPAAADGKVRFGVTRISSATVPVQVVAVDEPGVPSAPLVFVPGADSSGRHDGFLVSDITFEKGDRIELEAESVNFTLKFNRVRERGRGWVLAGYEVVGVGKI